MGGVSLMAKGLMLPTGVVYICYLGWVGSGLNFDNI